MNDFLFLLEVIGAWVLTVIVALPFWVLAYFFVTYTMECQCSSCLALRRKDYEN